MKVDLLKENTWYTVDLLKIKDDALRDKIMEEAGIDPDNVTYQESEDNIEFYGIPAEAVDWDSQEFDEEQLTLFEFLSKPPYKFTEIDNDQIYKEFEGTQTKLGILDKNEINILFESYKKIRDKKNLTFEDLKLLRLVKADVEFLE